jgi:hypothetical protein
VHFWEVLANVRWAMIALQQSDRYLVGGARDLVTAIIGRRATECELELLMLLDPNGPVASPPPAAATQAVPITLRDLPSGAALSALGRDLIDELLPLLPPERHRELRLVATAMAIAEREAIAGDAPARDILERLQGFYEDIEISDVVDEAATPSLLRMRGREGPAPEAWEGGGWDMLRRFAAELRVGAFDACDMRVRAARAILWRITMMKLREGNPHFLAANGFGE